MEFDRWTVLFLRRREDAPPLSEAESAALQDAHLAYLARLHEDGRLVAAGPVQGVPELRLAGVCIYTTSVEDAQALAQEDPAVRAGVFRVELWSWWVPGGALRFDPVRFPHSMAEVGEKSTPE